MTDRRCATTTPPESDQLHGSTMRYLQAFRDLTGKDGRLGLYTKDTQRRIPETGGCYAWFLPLWLYRDNLDEFLSTVGNLLGYEPAPKQEIDAPFNWERVRLVVSRSVDMGATDSKHDTWNRILADPRAREVLQRTLIEASLLLPPLYVGKTDNLRRRYVQHTQGRGDGNAFHRRFNECVQSSKLALSVSDLLFVCIRTPQELRDAFESASVQADELNLLTERLLMLLCRPPFSLK